MHAEETSTQQRPDAVLEELAAKEREIENLHVALSTSRTIGVALGILMTRHQVTRDEAFRMLAVQSQSANTKLIRVAEHVEMTGALPPGSPSGGAQDR